MFIVHVHSHATAHAARVLSSGCAGGIRARPAASSPPAIRTDARAIALVPWLRSLATAVTVANHALELRGCESLCARARLRAGVGRAGVYAGRGSCVDRAGPALRLDLALPRHSSPFDPDERRPNKHQPLAASCFVLLGTHKRCPVLRDGFFFGVLYFEILLLRKYWFCDTNHAEEGRGGGRGGGRRRGRGRGRRRGRGREGGSE